MRTESETEVVLNGHERRSAHRKRIGIPVKYRLMLSRASRAGLLPREKYCHGRLINFSRGGMALVVNGRLQAGQNLEVYLPPCPAWEEGVLAAVKVVRSIQVDDISLVGVSFEDRNALTGLPISDIAESVR